jgi:hypothetical protein
VAKGRAEVHQAWKVSRISDCLRERPNFTGCPIPKMDTTPGCRFK